MQISIDIEALDTLLERAPSAARRADHLDADEMVGAALTALAPLPIVDASNPGGSW
jgi:hypothetical protein